MEYSGPLQDNLIESNKNIPANINKPNIKNKILIKYETPLLANKKSQKNEIRTSKYTYYNFFFRIVLEQFSQIANIYFLILGIFQVKFFYFNKKLRWYLIYPKQREFP